jgi:hypothetical protein
MLVKHIRIYIRATQFCGKYHRTRPTPHSPKETILLSSDVNTHSRTCEQMFLFLCMVFYVFLSKI